MQTSARKDRTEHAPPMLMLSTRLRGFMKYHGLTRSDMATVLKTPRGTLDHWLDDGVSPPACLIPLMDLLEQRSKVRTWLGVRDARKRPLRGRPFVRGNPYRFGDKRRETALGNAARSPE
jgi:hypothetical protein